MDNYLLMKRTKELEELSKELGFVRTYFLEDLTVLNDKTPKDLLKSLRKVSGKKIYFACSEEMLRFALEKTPVDIVMGAESINKKDSLHYVRGGLDQITCKIAASEGKVIGFSFSDALNISDREKLLARMRLNAKLCKKYKVEMIFSNFSKKAVDVRSAKDLAAFWRVIIS